jgi:gliding motility-associated-like protein
MFHVIVQGRLKAFHISVYNRFGNMVYSSSDVNESWEGTLKGMPAPTGIYVYVITGVSYDNKNIKQKGIITLLK